LVYGSTFLRMTSSFAGTNRPPGGAAWVIADVGALVSLALFTLAAWGVFRSKWCWERAASAIRCSDTVTMPGGERRADALIAAAPSRGWQRISAGAGAHGPREFDWARIPVRTGWKRGRGHWLLARRSVSDRDREGPTMVVRGIRSPLESLPRWRPGRRADQLALR